MGNNLVDEVEILAFLEGFSHVKAMSSGYGSDTVGVNLRWPVLGQLLPLRPNLSDKRWRFEVQVLTRTKI